MSNKQPLISKVKVYGLEDSVKASKYPMATDTDNVNDDIVKTTINLAQSKTGHGHDQFETGIIVQFDLNCTLKMWTEAQRYTWLDFVSSQSTMHRITEFNLDEAYNEYVHPYIIDIMRTLVEDYNLMCEVHGKDSIKATEAYLKVLYNNPTGFILTARMTTNYRQLKTIYQQRKNHRLHEWKQFCSWIETLPHAYLITGK